MLFQKREVNMEGSTVVVPSVSVGNVPQLAMDLLINTMKPVFVGHLYQEDLLPIVGQNAYGRSSTHISSSCEVYFHADQRLVLLQVRGAILTGHEAAFSKELTNWMSNFNPKKLITLISVPAEIRKDKDLEGCQIRYRLPLEMKKEFEDKFMDYGWSEYEDQEDTDSEKLGAYSDTRVYIPSGGFGQHLFDIGNHRGLPSLAMMMYAYEGDNENDALAMADAVTSLLGLGTSKWKKPVSWGLPYGSGPPPEIY